MLLAKSVFIPFGLTAAALDAGIHKKIPVPDLMILESMVRV